MALMGTNITRAVHVPFVYYFREYSGVCSPPVLHGITASSSLDDISTLSNISPRKTQSGKVTQIVLDSTLIL